MAALEGDELSVEGLPKGGPCALEKRLADVGAVLVHADRREAPLGGDELGVYALLKAGEPFALEELLDDVGAALVHADLREARMAALEGDELSVEGLPKAGPCALEELLDDVGAGLVHADLREARMAALEGELVAKFLQELSLCALEELPGDVVAVLVCRRRALVGSRANELKERNKLLYLQRTHRAGSAQNAGVSNPRGLFLFYADR
jgi:hypothetical protein